MLGADTRATEGAIVCDKNCEKIHYIAPNIYCCGAGTSADTENSTSLFFCFCCFLFLLFYVVGILKRFCPIFLSFLFFSFPFLSFPFLSFSPLFSPLRPNLHFL